MPTKTKPKKPIDTSVPFGRVKIETTSKAGKNFLELLEIDPKRDAELASETLADLATLLTWYVGTIKRLPEKPMTSHLLAGAKEVAKCAAALAELSITPEMSAALDACGADSSAALDGAKSLVDAAQELVKRYSTTPKGSGGNLKERIAGELNLLKTAAVKFFDDNSRSESADEEDRKDFVSACVSMVGG